MPAFQVQRKPERRQERQRAEALRQEELRAAAQRRGEALRQEQLRAEVSRILTDAVSTFLHDHTVGFRVSDDRLDLRLRLPQCRTTTRRVWPRRFRLGVIGVSTAIVASMSSRIWFQNVREMMWL